MYNKEFDDLIKELSKTFEITKSQAKKHVLKLIVLERRGLDQIEKQVKKIRETIIKCDNCQALILSNEECPFEDELRDKKKLCIVSSQTVLEKIENNGFYNGIYFVLNLDKRKRGIDINQINIDKIFNLVDKFSVKEVVIATDPNFNGEMVATYISEQLTGKVKTTRLGYGLTFGSNLDYANSNTLEYAFKNRKEKNND